MKSVSAMGKISASGYWLRVEMVNEDCEIQIAILSRALLSLGNILRDSNGQIFGPVSMLELFEINN